MPEHYFTPARPVKNVCYILKLGAVRMRVRATHRAILELLPMLWPPTHRSSGGTAMMKLSIFLLWLALGLYEQARQWKRLGRMAREYEKEVRS